jgi:glycogen debranching enzyme GlgX
MTSESSLSTGNAYPLGAHSDGNGVNFALVAPNAQAVELCIFDESGTQEMARLALPAQEHGVWHGYLSGAEPGLIYGYRVHGNYAPQEGHRFNANKVLLDPYARLVVGNYLGQDEFCGQVGRDSSQLNPNDTAAIALKAKVTAETYDWGNDAAPRVPLAQMLMYEAHVKGLTQLHPEIPSDIRGSYAGLAHPVTLDHLQKIGVTTVSLLPVHHRADEARLQKMGLSNYWGYSSIAFFAPETRYWSGRAGSTPISEFRDMVKSLHARGIEVVLDVVYNHTGETDEFGPTLSFRGIDNALYYHLQPNDRSLYENWTGCGNCLNVSEPRVLQLVMDSLRYWVREMHVDGFRFDLAPELARDRNGYSRNAAFLAALRQDPVLSQVKLIAEPWDIGPGGYQLGNFPTGWQEWNDKYRDTMRSFWLHQWPPLGEFAQRFAASSEVFNHDGRLPTAGVNFISAHDGFNLQDLVSYNHKHNHANGEDNRDGHSHNHSWNCGVEGACADANVTALRKRLKRALLATLLFSQGTPMMLAGDEIGHTQGGNNNAYCQNNALSWLDWSKADQDLIDFVAQISALRKRFPVLRHPFWFTGQTQTNGQRDITWLKQSGGTINGSEWSDRTSYCLGILFGARAGAEPSVMADANKACLLILNAEAQDLAFALPPGNWQLVLDTASFESGVGKSDVISQSAAIAARSLLLLVQKNT